MWRLELDDPQFRTGLFAQLPSAGPDGMAIDVEGMLWVAHWGGGQVVRWNPATGQAIQRIRMPVTQPSACAFGGPSDLLIRLDAQPTEKANQDLQTKVRDTLSRAQPGTKVLRSDVVGASVSKELFTNGILALVISLAMILVYIWFRFEWQFAVGAVR